MPIFEQHECSDPACGLRLPIEIDLHRGDFCPRCGQPMRCAEGAYQNWDCRAHKRKPVRKWSVILDNIRSAYNVGAIFRTADGAGVAHLYLCGITPNPKETATIEKTALGATESVAWSSHLNAVTAARALKNQGTHLVALECTSQAIPIEQFLLNMDEAREITLIMGNECAGVDPGLIDLCATVVSLPMAGEKSSLNVAVAFGVAAYLLSFGNNLEKL